MKTYKNLIGALCVFLITLVLFSISIYRYLLSPTSTDTKIIEVEIKEGTRTKKIAEELKEKGLIRNKTVFYLYVKFNHINIKASTYNFLKIKE